MIHAREPARKDRFEGGEKTSLGYNYEHKCNFHVANQSDLCSPNMLQSMSSPYGSAIGKNNCIELVLSESAPQGIGGLMGGAMGMAGRGSGGPSTRTYYATASSAAEAEEWCKAIQHNIDVRRMLTEE